MTKTAQEWVPPDADLAELRKAAASCRGCELWEPATQVVFSAGNAHAALMMVGEQPGDVEDREGVPFVGPAGRLLQRAVDEAGIARSDVSAVLRVRGEEHERAYAALVSDLRVAAEAVSR